MKTLYKSVVFVDLDSTIITGFDSQILPRITSELAKKSGLGLDEVLHLVLQENHNRQKDPGVPATRAMDWDDILTTVAQKLGVRLEKSAWEIFKECADRPYSDVLDNAYTVLEKLRAPHRAIVAATKGLSKYQISILNALALTPLFDGILTPDSNGALKRDAVFYGQWPKLADLQILVGDDYEDDVLAPKEFGFKTIWKPQTHDNGFDQDPFDRPKAFNYPNGHSTRPDAIIFSLKELPDVVARLERETSLIVEIPLQDSRNKASLDAGRQLAPHQTGQLACAAYP